MHLSPNAVACAMRTKNSGVQGRRARSARYTECANVVCFDLGAGRQAVRGMQAPLRVRASTRLSTNGRDAPRFPVCFERLGVLSLILRFRSTATGLRYYGTLGPYKQTR